MSSFIKINSSDSDFYSIIELDKHYWFKMVDGNTIIGVVYQGQGGMYVSECYAHNYYNDDWMYEPSQIVGYCEFIVPQ